jgi:hypothetical protein
MPFYMLTGYASTDIMGRNCRMLQAPGIARHASLSNGHSSGDQHGVGGGAGGGEVARSIRHAVDRNEEMQAEIVNYRKDGGRFTNLLSIVPVRWDSTSPDFQYSVGFLCDKEALEDSD